eukprot:s38_g21.t2
MERLEHEINRWSITFKQAKAEESFLASRRTGLLRASFWSCLVLILLLLVNSVYLVLSFMNGDLQVSGLRAVLIHRTSCTGACLICFFTIALCTCRSSACCGLHVRRLEQMASACACILMLAVQHLDWHYTGKLHGIPDVRFMDDKEECYFYSSDTRPLHPGGNLPPKRLLWFPARGTKHFCCGECGRTFGSVTSLRVHMLNSYKKSLKEVPHAMSGRENPDVVVHGMDGIPQDILEERMQKSKADADDKRAEEKERSKGAPKVDPSSPASKSLPTAMPSTSPEPQSGQKQAAASPETGNPADLPPEPPTPNQKLEEDVAAAVTSLPPALKLLVPELLEETPQCEGLPDALASLHSIAVQALASFGLLQPGSYGANKMDAVLQAAVAAVKQPIKPSQVQPVIPDVPSAALGPTVSRQVFLEYRSDMK